jgi:hypothetical protein
VALVFFLLVPLRAVAAAAAAAAAREIAGAFLAFFLALPYESQHERQRQ